MKLFAGAIASSYLALAANVVWSLGSIPLALRYLSDEQFGLWSLILVISSYLSLIDFGLSSASARLLIDHKDDPDRRAYGGLVKSAWLIALLQAVIVTLAAFAAAVCLAPVLRIPEALTPEFRWLMCAQGVVVGFSFAMRMFAQLLYTHHRLDLANYGITLNYVVSFTVMWIGFRAGFGMASLVWSSAVAAILSAAFNGACCSKLRLLPRRGEWGGIRKSEFTTFLSLGKDLFLITVATQLLLGAPAILITRFFGLADAGVWNACTRAFSVLCHISWRPLDMSFTLFCEMYARGELDRLRERFEALFRFTIGFTALGAVGLAFCNQPFVDLLTDGRLVWARENDFLLGLWLLAITIVRCHSYLAQATKEIVGLRRTYLIEAIVFVGSTALTIRWGGFPAVIVCATLCAALFTARYGIRATARLFHLPAADVGLYWMGPAARLFVTLAPLGTLLAWLARPLPALGQMVVIAAPLGVIGVILLSRVAATAALRQEIYTRLPSPLRAGFALAAGLKRASQGG